MWHLGVGDNKQRIAMQQFVKPPTSKVSISELIRNVYVMQRTMHHSDLSEVSFTRFSYRIVCIIL